MNNKLKRSLVAISCASLLSVGGLSNSFAASHDPVMHNTLKDTYFGLATKFGQFISWTEQTRIIPNLLQQKASYPDYSILFGGLVELDQQFWSGNMLEGAALGGITVPGLADPKNKGRGAYVTQANVDVLVNTGPWVSGYVSLAGYSYDPNNAFVATTERSVDLNDAMLMLGNTSKSPFYGYLGVTDLPFGDFTDASRYPVYNLQAYSFYAGNSYQQAGLGFAQNGFNVLAAMYLDPNANETETNQHFDNFVINASYHNDVSQGLGFRLNASYLKNVYKTKLKTWFLEQGSAVTNTPERMPAGMVSGELTMKASAESLYSLRLSYSQLLKSATYGGLSQKPGIYSVLGLVTYPVYKLPVTMRLSYARGRNNRNIYGILPIYDMRAAFLSSANNGLKSSWDASVTLPVFAENLNISLDYQRINTYDGKHLNVVTLDEVLIW